MSRAATIALVLAALILGFVARGDRPSRPVRIVYEVSAKCEPEAKFKKKPETFRA